MKIAVLIKHVPVSNDVSVDPDTHALIRANSEGMINPADLNAIEAALVLKEQTGGQVTVFTMGPPDAEKSLRDAMAMGCDDSCLVTDRCFAGGDTIATAKVLAAGIKHYGEFDLILGGALSSDGATGQVGAMVSEYLQIPHISEIHQMDYEEEAVDKLNAVKKYQGNQFCLQTSLPALLTVCFGANIPRLATLRTKRAAKSKPLAIYTNEDLKFPPHETGLAGSPTEVIDSFEPESKKKAKFISGTPEEAAREIKALIQKEEGRD